MAEKSIKYLLESILIVRTKEVTVVLSKCAECKSKDCYGEKMLSWTSHNSLSDWGFKRWLQFILHVYFMQNKTKSVAPLHLPLYLFQFGNCFTYKFPSPLRFRFPLANFLFLRFLFSWRRYFLFANEAQHPIVHVLFLLSCFCIWKAAI